MSGNFKTSLILSVVLAMSVPGRGQTVEDILWWLPQDTETVFVTQSPFTLRPPSDATPTNLTAWLRTYSSGSIEPILDGKLLVNLTGVTIERTVEGSRKFRRPAELGACTYEGCHIFVSKEDLTKFLDSSRKHAEKRKKINQCEVLEFNGIQEKTKWTWLIAAPRTNIFLVATSENYLREVLDRMTRRPKFRALTNDLAEWQHLNRESPYWALRHYQTNEAEADPTSPHSRSMELYDPQAIGFTFQYDPKKNQNVQIVYLSKNTKIEEHMNTFWTDDDLEMRPVVKAIQGVRVDVLVPIKNQDQVALFMLKLATVLGHCAYF